MSHPVDLSKLTAEQLDDLITDAWQLWATLQPPHPAEAPKGEQVAMLDPAWSVGLENNGDTHLQLRHHGVGWLSFRIPPNERSHLLTVLLHQALVLLPKVEGQTAPPLSGSGGGTLH